MVTTAHLPQHVVRAHVLPCRDLSELAALAMGGDGQVAVICVMLSPSTPTRAVQRRGRSRGFSSSLASERNSPFARLLTILRSWQ